MEQILVTGGAGFIGSHTCEALLNKEFSVLCIDDFNSYYDPKIKEKNIEQALKNHNFALYKIGITDKEALTKVFQENKISKIIHLAARAGVRASFEDKELYELVNIEGTRNLLELAKEFKIKNFVFGSSSSVYGTNTKIPFSEIDKTENQISPYAKTKKAAELLCKEYHDNFNLDITCLRFFTVYGPRGRPDMAIYKFTKLINEGKEIEVYGNTKSKRDYTFVTDIVDGILSALKENLGFEIINLGDSNPIEIKYLIGLIEQELNQKAKIKVIKEQRGDVDITYAEISKAKKLLGYEPKIKIEQGIKLFVKWFKKEAV